MSRALEPAKSRIPVVPVERVRSPFRLLGGQPPALGYHLVLRLVDDGPIATSSAERRLAATSFLSAGRDHGLLAFAIADTHAHAVTVADRARAGELARRVQLSMHRRLRLRARFEPARVRPIEDPRHLRRTFFYVLGQLARHAPNLDPCHEGTALPDLLGLRVVADDLPLRVHEALPRLGRDEVSALLPVRLDTPVPLDWGRLAEAAAAAFALPELSGRARPVTRARQAAVHAADALSSGELAELLGVTPTCVRYLRRAPHRKTDIAAVLLQLRLRTAVASTLASGEASGEL